MAAIKSRCGQVSSRKRRFNLKTAVTRSRSHEIGGVEGQTGEEGQR